jgi:uncharacterized protein DUF3761
MNHLLSLALAAALAVPVRPIAVEPDSSSIAFTSGSVAFTSTRVWLRAAPFNGKRIALLTQGAQVRIVRCAEEACKVTFRSLTGYVGQEFLQNTTVRQPVEAGRGYINSQGQWIPSPTHTVDGQPPAGATARCRDGSYSFSQSRRGTCSWHGGVALWL